MKKPNFFQRITGMQWEVLSKCSPHLQTQSTRLGIVLIVCPLLTGILMAYAFTIIIGNLSAGIVVGLLITAFIHLVEGTLVGSLRKPSLPVYGYRFIVFLALMCLGGVSIDVSLFDRDIKEVIVREYVWAKVRDFNRVDSLLDQNFEQEKQQARNRSALMERYERRGYAVRRAQRNYEKNRSSSNRHNLETAKMNFKQYVANEHTPLISDIDTVMQRLGTNRERLLRTRQMIESRTFDIQKIGFLKRLRTMKAMLGEPGNAVMWFPLIIIALLAFAIEFLPLIQRSIMEYEEYVVKHDELYQ